MKPHQEITHLRKSGRLDEAYTRGRELLDEYPGDMFIKSGFGWVLYEKLKQFIEIANGSRSTQNDISAGKVREILGEYYGLDLDRPDLLFSLLLSQTLRFPGELKFLPRFMMWAGINSFRPEDLEVSTTDNGQVFESLLEKAARSVGKIAGQLTTRDYPNVQELQTFAVDLIDYAFQRGNVQKPEWLIYRKALLLKSLGKLDEAKSTLIPFVKKKHSDFWAWHALGKIMEHSSSALALSLYAKACLTCRDWNFGVGVFEDLSRLATSQGEKELAKWSAEKAFTIRGDNGWKIPDSLHNLFNTHSHCGVLSNPQEKLSSIAGDAERILWEDCPKYDANYLGTFLNRNERRMIKFGLSHHGEPKEIVSPERRRLDSLSLSFGDPVTVTIDESGERLNVIAVEKRESGRIFDSLPFKTGQIHLKEGGFGFLDDIYVPPNLARQVQDEQMVTLAFVKKLDKRRNRQGLAAIAIVNGPS